MYNSVTEIRIDQMHMSEIQETKYTEIRIDQMCMYVCKMVKCKRVTGQNI